MTRGPVAPVQRADRRRTWTAVGFMVGATLFAAGVPLSQISDLEVLAGRVFFAGSVFFTTAALLQFLSSRAQLDVARERGEHSWLGRWFHARDLDWTASAIQLVGTILFNVNTFRAATVLAPSTAEANRLIWTPDALGSIMFLASSAIAFSPEVRRRRHHHVRDRSWTIGALNLLGSVFFGLSALGALTLPATDELWNARWANLGTFLGAVCFLLGAALLLPPLRRRGGRGPGSAVGRTVAS